MPQALLQKTIEDFRRGLELRDRALLHRISASYHEMAADILDELKPLLNEIEGIRDAGGEITQAWLLRERRLSSLLAQVQDEMAGFAVDAIGLTQREQWKQIEEAIAHTLRVISLQTPVPASGVGFAFNRLSKRAIEAIVGATSKGSPLRKLLDDLGRDASKRIRKELIQGVAFGYGPAKTARRISDFLDGNRARALTIARTETIRAYRESGRQTALENSDLIESWTWVSSLVGACAMCIAMNGTEHPPDERLESHPQCRCVQRWNTKSWKELGMPGVPETGPEPVEPGAAWFARQSPTMQMEVLGQAGLKAYKQGLVKLEHFIGVSNSPEWGKGRFQRSLKAALAAAKADPSRLAFVPPAAPIVPFPAANSPTIGSKLLIPEGEEADLRRIADLIDAYHGDGPLHNLPIQFNQSSTLGAFYRAEKGEGPAYRITISIKFQSISSQEFTFVHELGHYLDHTGMNAGWFATETKDFSPAMTAFLKAVNASPQIKQIRKRPPSDYRNYLLRKREIWARAYSQYIATKTGDPGLLAGLDEWRNDGKLIHRLAQWTDEDFEPIMRAIDDLLLELGWRPKP